MKTATRHRRWWALLVLLACFAGTAYAQRTVTLTLNTATLPDTTNTTSLIEVRGAVDSDGDDNFEAPFTLPDDNVIDWGADTTLEPENMGGDYWRVSFQLPDDQELKFKFFSQQAEDPNGDGSGADGIGGWEDGSSGTDNDGNHILEAGNGDVEMPLHYFVKGARQPYDWRPFEAKEDTIAIHFRVFMNTEEALGAGVNYDRTDASQIIGVRGDPLDINGDGSVTGPLDWGATALQLAPESDQLGQPGYDLFSGTAYYPAELAGQTQAYKFFVEPSGWEQPDNNNPDNNRLFTVPAQDTTLHWVYYGDSNPASAQPVESLLIFAVDLSPFEEIGLFDPARGDTLWVYGGFNGWQECPNTNPDDCLMSRVPGEDQFEAAVLVSQIPGTNVQYKYFLDFNDETFMDAFGVEPPSGWEEGHATGTNRVVEFEGQSQQDFGVQFFNDITSNNVIPDGVSVDVNFEVDMSTALANEADPFDPAADDSVTIRSGDPIWAFTQGVTEDPRGGGDFPLFIDEFVLTDDDGDNVYTGTYTVTGPTYSALTFRYAYGQGNEFTEDNGTGSDTPGRNRTFYIKKNEDGSWPASYTIPAGTFQVEQGPLPFEPNPDISTAIEVIDDEVPSRISLSQNYPNPFNPSTTFEYTLDQTQRVTVRVYDVLGRLVTTLADGVQPAATYQVTFDAADLASGVYFYRLETPTTAITKRMLLMK